MIEESLPNPEPGHEPAWVAAHLAGLFTDEPVGSPRFRGTQAAADAALNAFDVAGYAGKRNEVLPVHKRGASGLSPWIRHGLLTLPELWKHVSGPSRDVTKFRDELLWQEYARHMYARLGTAIKDPIRYQPPVFADQRSDPWDRSMACVSSVMSELETDGWMVNQTRMWMASQWTIRHGADWRDGEDHFFRHLLDGSRAANRLGWQWTVGAGTGKPYGFSRWQVNKRAPGLCNSCPRKHNCPIENWPADQALPAINRNPLVDRTHDVNAASGPLTAQVFGEPEMVWLTAESLGTSDPALARHESLPVVFVFDKPLLQRLQLSAKRLIFLTERLAEIGQERDLTVALGQPSQVLGEIKLATTFAPVPGWKRNAATMKLTAVYPWPWLRKPSNGSLSSFSAWNR